jgi:ABC-type phosphate transport system auxiliary subunit
VHLRHPDRIPAFYGLVGKILNAYTQPQCLVVQEAARTGGAYGIHAEIDHHTVAYYDYLAVLAAYLDYVLTSGK